MRLATTALLALLLVGGTTACGEGAEGGENSDTSDRRTAVTEPTDGEASTDADDIPVAFTPTGGYGDEMPGPILATCTEPLVDGAPDLRGFWEVVAVEVDGQPVDEHPIYEEVQRVEQCGDRLIVTGSGVVHDMRCDGTEENGVHDVSARDFTTPIDVVATYEDGVHTLRPVGLPLEITRRLEGEQMVWTYPGFTARLERVADPADATT